VIEESQKDNITEARELSEYYIRRWIEGLEKFLYFMVGLNFAVLGISVQVTKHLTWITVGSWAFLLISAFSGIYLVLLDFRKSNFIASLLRQVPPLTGSNMTDNMMVRLEELSKLRKRALNILLLFFVFGVLGLAIDRIVGTKAGTLLIGANDHIQKDWHRYENRVFGISGKDRAFVQVLSDGWKIIAKTDIDSDLYEWGWEIIIKDLKDLKEGGRFKFVHMLKIHYTLLDEDGFELASDESEHAVEYGKTGTFRHSNTISTSKALRATQSKFWIAVD